MTLKIDNVGRIVVPKKLRERLGLRPGSALEITESADGILIAAVDRKPSLVKEGRFLVHTGRISRDAGRWIEDDRDERFRKLAGI